MSDSTEKQSVPKELPRLRIHHFFVLTTVFAVVMSVWLGLFRLIYYLRPDAGKPEFGAGMSLIFSVQSLSQSVCFSITLLGLAWRRRGIYFPSQPGHWMAIYLTITWAYEIVISLASLFLQTQTLNLGLMVWATMPVSLVFHCFVLILWVAAYLHEPTRIWKLGWAAMALKSLLSVLLMLLYIGANYFEWLLEVFWYNAQFDWHWQFSMPLGSYAGLLSTLPHYALLTFIPIAAFIDLRQHRRLHWSHWLVLISTFVSTAVQTVYYHLTF